MTRLLKKPIVIESDIRVDQEKKMLKVSGPRGNISLMMPEGLMISVAGGELTLVQNNKIDKSIMGLYNSLIQNAVSGVKKGWTKTLELVGVGFRASTDGQELTMNLGYSHPVKIKAPEDIFFKVVKNKVIVEGVDKYLVGEVAASVRRAKPPEPYKGKGIRYQGEVIRRKAGKAAKTVGITGVK